MKMNVVYLLVIFISLGFLLSGIQTATGYYADPDEYGFHSIMTSQMYMGIAISIISSFVAVLVLSRMQSFSF